MTGKLIFAVPSKGRLMQQCADRLAAAGLLLRKISDARGYRGEIEGLTGIEVAYVSSPEIAQHLKTGKVHLGITGEDLVRETMPTADEHVTFLVRLGFGHADVVVAVPDCWLDVTRMIDLRRIAPPFRQRHGRPLRVASKFVNLARAFFNQNGITDYRVVESLGATEGAPAAGAADLIVDITTTGTTLNANGLRVLSDGVILRSEANLLASRTAAWSPAQRQLETSIVSAMLKGRAVVGKG